MAAGEFRSVFERSCFEATLRTLSLRPNDILQDDKRLPDNRNDPLLRVARPTWIGRNYRVGGVLLLGKNPAGGSVSHQEVSHPSDAGLALALKSLAEKRSLSSYREWRDVAQPKAMETWRIWYVSVKAILKELQPLGIGDDGIAFGNLVPFRTVNNEVAPDEFTRGWRCDAGPTIAVLKPGLIVKMTSGFPALSRFAVNTEVLRFRRHIGDTTVSKWGQYDLGIIREWAERNRRRGG